MPWAFLTFNLIKKPQMIIYESDPCFLQVHTNLFECNKGIFKFPVTGLQLLLTMMVFCWAFWSGISHVSLQLQNTHTAGKKKKVKGKRRGKKEKSLGVTSVPRLRARARVCVCVCVCACACVRVGVCHASVCILRDRITEFLKKSFCYDGKNYEISFHKKLPTKN